MIEEKQWAGSDFLNEFASKLSLHNVGRMLEQKQKEFDMFELKEQLNETLRDINTASQNFEFAKETDLIDYYIYQMKASEMKYQYLIKKVKQEKWGVN